MSDIRLIAAVDIRRGIARDGAIPWDLPQDRQRFRELTVGGVVIMGRKTYEVIGHALPDRRNIVLSRQVDYKVDDAEVMHDIDAALKIEAPILWIIGGEELYKATLAFSNKLELTKVDGDYGCDKFFPPFESDFILTDTSLPQHDNNLTFVYATYSRK